MSMTILVLAFAAVLATGPIAMSISGGGPGAPAGTAATTTIPASDSISGGSPG